MKKVYETKILTANANEEFFLNRDCLLEAFEKSFLGKNGKTKVEYVEKTLPDKSFKKEKKRS